MKLTVSNASFSYSKDKSLINNLGFEISSGDVLAILGPNGSGKTTLLRALLGFLKWNSGEAFLDGVSISKIPPRQFWRRVSYVPQAKNVTVSYTALDMILLGLGGTLGVFSAPGDKDKEAVLHLCQRLGIAKLLDKRCNEISGGELQMVLIARALISNPELLILDEPESNLDFKNQLIVLDTISRLAKEGMCCIFNTHYPAHALTRATKSLILTGSGEAIFGETPKVVTEENIQKAFGVKAVISEVETPEHIYHNIMPLEVSNASDISVNAAGENVIAVVSIISKSNESSSAINSVLHDYNEYLVGRMGIPYRDGGVYIMNLTLDAPIDKVQILSHKLSLIENISVKTTYAKRKD